jgi:hypothetical protein
LIETKTNESMIEYIANKNQRVIDQKPKMKRKEENLRLEIWKRIDRSTKLDKQTIERFQIIQSNIIIESN